MAMVWLAGGCAPKDFGRAVAYYADKAAVTDAAARHTSASPYYRFDTALICALDDVLAAPSSSASAEATRAILRAASALAQTSTTNEIERMPAKPRQALAKLAGVQSGVTALQQHFVDLAGAALDHDLRHVTGGAQVSWHKKLRAMRRGIESLADDKGRWQRRVMFSWAAIPTAVGIAQEEAKLPEKIAAKARKSFDRIAIWRPAVRSGDALIDRYAPIIAMAWPKTRRYDANADRIGAVTLSRSNARIEVTIDPANPTVYVYTTQASIGGRTYPQLNYVWWFPERPKLAEDDAVASHVDGAMLRITVGADGQPMFVESSLNCGCGHEVFVSQNVELAAERAFGPPLPGKRFAIERHLRGKYDIVVANAFDLGARTSRPLVLAAAGYHEVCQVRFDPPEAIAARSVVERAFYRLVSYDELDRLPVEGGVASMFGPDGLVHHAGRPEGVLLAPSGILSAGQPRKRGTQRVRWDGFLHDDPHLLEKTLRMPPLD